MLGWEAFFLTLTSMKKLLIFFLFCLSFPPFPATAQGEVVFYELNIDPLGGDTGNEWVTLWNSGDEPIDLSGWELDADQLPYWTIPEGVILDEQDYLRIQLRQEGTGSGNILYTGSSFGSSNMGNTKGSVTLFRAGGRTAAYLEDFVQWGSSDTTHVSTAAETGLFDPTVFLEVLTEGLIYRRQCLFWARECFTEGHALPWGVGDEVQDTGSGDVLDEGMLQVPQLILWKVFPVNNKSIGDVIELKNIGDEVDNAHQYDGWEIIVDALHYDLSDMVNTGESVYRIVLGTNPTSSNVWEALEGLVSTTEQIYLTYKGAIVDVVCWERMPIAQNELSESLSVRTYWSGDCLSSEGLQEGDFWQRRDPLTTEKDAWLRSTLAPTTNDEGGNEESPTIPTTTTCIPPQAIRLSEILPNPDGTDTGNEWVELVNTSGEETFLCGLLLDDGEGGSSPYTIPEQYLSPGAFLVISDAMSGISLGNTADAVRVFTTEGALIDTITYTSAPSGKSFSKVE